MSNLTEIQAMRRNRALWTGVVMVVAFVLLGFGGTFLIGGLNVAPLPQVYEAITRYVPGGLRTYGGVMVLLAFSLLHGIIPGPNSRPDDMWTHYTLGITWGIAFGVAISFAASWALTGVQTWSAILYWTSMAALAALCWRNPPTDGGPRRVA